MVSASVVGLTYMYPMILIPRNYFNSILENYDQAAVQMSQITETIGRLKQQTILLTREGLELQAKTLELAHKADLFKVEIEVIKTTGLDRLKEIQLELFETVRINQAVIPFKFVEDVFTAITERLTGRLSERAAEGLGGSRFPSPIHVNQTPSIGVKKLYTVLTQAQLESEKIEVISKKREVLLQIKQYRTVSTLHSQQLLVVEGGGEQLVKKLSKITNNIILMLKH